MARLDWHPAYRVRQIVEPLFVRVGTAWWPWTKRRPVTQGATGLLEESVSSPVYFFGAPVVLSFFIMSAHMASFFIMASSFFAPSFFAIAM